MPDGLKHPSGVACRYPRLSFRHFLQLRDKVRRRKTSRQAAVASEFAPRGTADTRQHDVSQPGLLIGVKWGARYVTENISL
jgi:hypothetical protein